MWKEIPELYDVARKVSHDFGLPWTDPRTGETFEPPTKKCRQYRPDHNGECLNCDEPIDSHQCAARAARLRCVCDAGHAAPHRADFDGMPVYWTDARREPLKVRTRRTRPRRRRAADDRSGR